MRSYINMQYQWITFSDGTSVKVEYEPLKVCLNSLDCYDTRNRKSRRTFKSLKRKKNN